MKKVFLGVLKSSKILVLLCGILVLTKVNYVSSIDKVKNYSFNKTIDLTAMAVKLDEIRYNDIYYPLDTFTGDLTGYAADCPLCTGYLYCNNQYVRYGTTTYEDATYGKVSIVASSKNLPCGSIVTFEAPFGNHEQMTAIVLDRGVLGNDLDFLVETEQYAFDNIGRHKISYDVLRFGWTRAS